MNRLVPIIILACALLTGCQSNLQMKRIAAKNPMSKNVVKTPTKMVDVWKTYAQTTPEGKAMRGIAGRIHFYGDSKRKRSIKVDGSLSVFVFDGDEKDPARAKPLKIYKFGPETLPKHYAYKKPLGHGYDFFLPFDEIGGEEKTLCVMARFDDQLEGQLVMTQPVNTILKGSSRALEKNSPENLLQEFMASQGSDASQTGPSEKLDPNRIEQVAFRQESSQNESRNENKDRVVTTISLNDNLTRGLSRASGTSSGSNENSRKADETEVQPALWNKEVGSSIEEPQKMGKMNYPKTEYRSNLEEKR